MGVSTFLIHLYAAQAERLRTVHAHLGPDLTEDLIATGTLRIVRSHLGPLITLGVRGLLAVNASPRPIAMSTATQYVALREAVALALERGYTVEAVEGIYVRLGDRMGRTHLLYVRPIAPSAAALRALFRHHRSSLGTQGTIIIYTATPEQLARVLQYRPNLQVWPADQ